MELEDLEEQEIFIPTEVNLKELNRSTSSGDISSSVIKRRKQTTPTCDRVMRNARKQVGILKEKKNVNRFGKLVIILATTTIIGLLNADLIVDWIQTINVSSLTQKPRRGNNSSKSFPNLFSLGWSGNHKVLDKLEEKNIEIRLNITKNVSKVEAITESQSLPIGNFPIVKEEKLMERDEKKKVKDATKTEDETKSMNENEGNELISSKIQPLIPENEAIPTKEENEPNHEKEEKTEGKPEPNILPPAKETEKTEKVVSTDTSSDLISSSSSRNKNIAASNKKVISTKVLLVRDPSFDSFRQWSQWLHARIFKEGVPREQGSINFIDEEHGISEAYDGFYYTPPDIRKWNKTLVKRKSAMMKRVNRFPSVEDRIKFYMGKWYNKPSHDVFGSEFVEISKSMVNISEKKNITNLFSTPIVNPFELNPLALWSFCKDFSKPSKDKEKRLAQLYIRDIIDLAILHQNKTTPVLVKIGDGSSRFELDTNHTFPIFSKTRDLIAENNTPTKRCDVEKSCARCGCGEIHSTIIWPMNRGRQYKHAAMVPLYDIPWEQKKGQMIWRGIFDEKTLSFLENVPTKLSGWKQRKVFVDLYQNSTLIDAKFTNDVYASSHSTFMDKRALLRYKYLIAIEADDISSGLKWMLFSNSLLFLPPITYASYAMESLLEPFVHYIPVYSNMSNVEEMINWAETHPNEAKLIAERGTLFIYDLLFHPDAYYEEELVLKGIMERYENNFAEGR